MRIEHYLQSLHLDCQKLVGTVITLEEDPMRSRTTVEGVASAMQGVASRVQQLMAHCNVILVNDGLKDWHEAQADKAKKAPGDLDFNAVSRKGGVRGCGLTCPLPLPPTEHPVSEGGGAVGGSEGGGG